MRPDIENSAGITKDQQTELERLQFPQLLSRRSFLKELFLGTMIVVGAAISQEGYEAIVKSDNQIKRAIFSAFKK